MLGWRCEGRGYCSLFWGLCLVPLVFSQPGFPFSCPSGFPLSLPKSPFLLNFLSFLLLHLGTQVLEKDFSMFAAYLNILFLVSKILDS